MENAANILVATLGTTPQIVTEAIYYFATRRGILFTEVHAITTGPGRTRLHEALLTRTRGSNRLGRLLKELDVPPGALALSDRHIHVLRGSGGRELADIRTRDDSEAAGDQILDLVKRLCADDHVAVYATLAGGRKTMSAYLHAALQLVARPQDRLFHILLHPLIEDAIAAGRLPDFYYPTRALELGQTRVAREDQLDCVDIPLLYWPQADRRAMARRGLTYRGLVAGRRADLERLLAPPSLVVDPRSRTVVASGVPVRLTAEQFYWYYALTTLRARELGPLAVAALARARRAGQSGEPGRQSDQAVASARVMALLRHLYGSLFRGGEDMWDQKARVALTEKDSGLATVFSRVNTRLRTALRDAAAPYLVASHRGSGEYSLSIAPSAIDFRDSRAGVPQPE